MTQTITNYQETVNTLQFGQKAKNVKTTINVNEVETKGTSADVETARNELNKAKAKIKELEDKVKFLEK